MNVVIIIYGYLCQWSNWTNLRIRVNGSAVFLDQQQIDIAVILISW